MKALKGVYGKFRWMKQETHSMKINMKKVDDEIERYQSLIKLNRRRSYRTGWLYGKELGKKTQEAKKSDMKRCDMEEMISKILDRWSHFHEDEYGVIADNNEFGRGEQDGMVAWEMGIC